MKKAMYGVICFLGLIAWQGWPVSAGQVITKVLEFGGPNQAQTGLVEGPDGTLYSWDRGSDTNRTGRIASLGKGGSGVTPLHTFTGAPDNGDTPFGLVYGSDGVLYGVTADYQAKTRGRVFSLTLDGSIYRVLRRWDAATNEHGSPFGLIEGSDKVLYGVAEPGGTLGSSTVWKLNKDGNGYAVLADFEAGTPSPDTTYGPVLNGNLIEARDGKLYGTVGGGSFSDGGAVYRVNKDRPGFEIVHQFTGNGQGGGAAGRLLHASDGFLYGVGNSGGDGNKGVIYRLSLDGSSYQVLTSGSVGSADPENQLIESADGYLYGTCSNGGTFVAGLIYRVRLDGSGLETLHEFNLLAQPPLGINPTAPILGSDSNIYFDTLQQVSFVGAGQNRPFLLRFGPVPLPPSTAGQPQVVIQASVASAGQNHQFVLSFTGSADQQYDVQSAATLPPVWQSAQKVTADAAGHVIFQTNIPPASVSQFYRVAQ
jgi:uncharacterized repeat protein (TIGR03803 family)